jgi:hypothetical protein
MLSMHHAGPIWKPHLSVHIRVGGMRIAAAFRGDIPTMRLAILLCGFLLSVTPLGGGESLKMGVSPQQSFAPANLFVRLGIEPDAANRVVEVVAESENFYRSSQVALEGENGPRTVMLQFRNLPGGSYEVRGVVTDSRGREVAVAHQSVNVLPSGHDR